MKSEDKRSIECMIDEKKKENANGCKLQEQGNKRTGIVVFFLLVIILFVAVSAALMLGSVRMELQEMLTGLFTREETVEAIIMRQIRLPRMLAGLLAGVGLSVSGSLLQNVTDNGMASPNIIGVNAGAGFVMILMLYAIPTAGDWLAVGAFLGAFATTLLIVWTANRMGTSKVTIVLAGLVFTTLLNAGISFMSLLDTDVLATYNHFSVGSLAQVKSEQLVLPAILILLSVATALIWSDKIKILCLGDEMATSLGVHVKRVRILCLLCASAAAAAVVSFAGLLGFVGLIVPHIARRFAKGNLKRELIYSVFAGAILVLLADTVGRVVFAPTEVPVGIVMALIGAPFFLFLLLRRGEHA